VRQSQILGSPGTPVQRQSVVIQEITSGFEVVPRLSGSTVFLEISQQREQPGAVPGSVQGQSATTTVSARLGEWVELGAISGAQSRDERGILSAARERSADSRRIWVRVDEVRP
jgi:hypothetical protein